MSKRAAPVTPAEVEKRLFGKHAERIADWADEVEKELGPLVPKHAEKQKHDAEDDGFLRISGRKKKGGQHGK